MKVKTKIRIYAFGVICVVIALTHSCKKTTEESKVPVPNETVTDIDGNVYHTVTIGYQTWMVENLKTTSFNDSSKIQLVTDSSLWENISTPQLSVV